MATKKSLAGQKTDRRMGRQWLSIRCSPDTKRALEQATKLSGRSLSAEAELLVEAGLAGERHFEAALAHVAGEQGAGLLELTAYLMKQQGDFLDDAESFATVRRQINCLLDAVAPPDEPDGDERADDEVEALLGKLFRLSPSAPWMRWAIHLMEKRLGRDAARRIMRWVAARRA
jgi:hypothetical protein